MRDKILLVAYYTIMFCMIKALCDEIYKTGFIHGAANRDKELDAIGKKSVVSKVIEHPFVKKDVDINDNVPETAENGGLI